MSRIQQLSQASGLDWRNARSVSGIDASTLDLMLALALQGQSAAEIVDALPDARVVDGYRPARPLAESDAQTMVSWVAQLRRVLAQRHRRLDDDARALDDLVDAVLGETEVPA